MIPNPTAWIRVSRTNPCPVCQHHDWCAVSADAALAICMRVSEESIKRTRNGGFLHKLADTPRRPARLRALPLTPPPTRYDLPALAENYRTAVNPARLARLARTLGLSVPALTRLSVGWCFDSGAWSFPMVDARGTVVGIRLRLDNGRKFAVTGGREGLFVPAGLSGGGPLFVCEGPTDCAALLDMGLDAVGRPSCAGGVRHLTESVRLRRPRSVVILADADAPGQRGAEDLAAVLVALVPELRTITPPPGVKDARAWRIAGATADDVLDAVASVRPRTLKIAWREPAEVAC